VAQTLGPKSKMIGIDELSLVFICFFIMIGLALSIVALFGDFSKNDMTPSLVFLQCLFCIESIP